MQEDTKKHSIVEAIIKLASAMQIDVIADGVSNEETLRELKKLGCKYGEGKYFESEVVMSQKAQG